MLFFHPVLRIQQLGPHPENKKYGVSLQGGLKLNKINNNNNNHSFI